MKMTERETKDMAALDALFADVRDAEVPEVSDGVMARILADADAALALPALRSPRAGWRDWVTALGGWPAMGGLMAAGVAGLWIGVAPTGTVSDVMAGVLGETVAFEVFPDADIFGLEAEG